LGHLVGRTLRGGAPLQRYALNIAGSILGIALFAALSAVGAPPWAWMLLAGLVSLAGLMSSAGVAWKIVGVTAAALMTVLAAVSTRDAVWSPYQKITIGPIHFMPDRGVVQEWIIPTVKPEIRRRLQTLPIKDG